MSENPNTGRISFDLSFASNRYAWLLATCPDAKLRDGAKAIELATRACLLTNWRFAECMETLAAANAEAGKFDDAVKWQSKVIEQFPSIFRAKERSSRLELYRSKKTYRVAER